MAAKRMYRIVRNRTNRVRVRSHDRSYPTRTRYRKASVR